MPSISAIPLSTVSQNGRPSDITNDETRQALRHACLVGGGAPVFGFGPEQIGNKSIRSGTAMALFIANHHPIRIQILGRWLSDAFLRYIRFQVLEWTASMSADIANLPAYIDVREIRSKVLSDNFAIGITNNPDTFFFSGQSPDDAMLHLHLHH